MKTTYKLTTSKLEGFLQVTYFNGYLNVVEIAFKNSMSEFQFDSLFRMLPYREDLDKFRMLGLQVEQIIEVPANKKIALFCKFYEQYKGIKYKATARDGGMIKNVVVTEDILKHYFESESFTFKGKQSVNNLVRYYNELLQEIAAKGKSQFPNHWTKEYESKLAPGQMSEYWKYLRSLGLKPIKNSVGVVTEWK